MKNLNIPVVSFFKDEEINSGLKKFMSGEERKMKNGRIRPGFNPNPGIVKPNQVLFFIVVPYGAKVEKSIMEEYDDAQKVIVAFLFNNRTMRVCGLKSPSGRLMENYVISFDGKNLLAEKESEFKEENFLTRCEDNRAEALAKKAKAEEQKTKRVGIEEPTLTIKKVKIGEKKDIVKDILNEPCRKEEATASTSAD